MISEKQYAAIERMGEDYHVVLVDPGEIPGSVKLTPAKFCEHCGGDGVDPDSYDKPEIEACSQCEGRGGVPVVYPATTVLPDGRSA